MYSHCKTNKNYLISYLIIYLQNQILISRLLFGYTICVNHIYLFIYRSRGQRAATLGTQTTAWKRTTSNTEETEHTLTIIVPIKRT